MNATPATGPAPARPGRPRPARSRRRSPAQPAAPDTNGRAPAAADAGLPLPVQATAAWSAVADALRRSGFGEAGPEYLRLSAVLQEQRSYEILRGSSAEDHWRDLRDEAAAALRLLEPLRQAALLITELPIDVTGAAQRPEQEEGSGRHAD